MELELLFKDFDHGRKYGKLAGALIDVLPIQEGTYSTYYLCG